MDAPTLLAGDRVILSVGADHRPALVRLTSANGQALVVAFDGQIGGWDGVMVLLYETDGSWRAIDGGRIDRVTLDPAVVGQA